MKIEVKGPIVGDGEQVFYDWFGIPATSANKVNNAMNQAKDGEELEVVINSGGGSVFAGSEIYTNLREYPGNVKVKIVGLAASAASVIAMAGDEIEMSPTGQMMIHNASVGAAGNKNDMIHTAEILKSIDESIANSYMKKTGMSQEALLELMDNETWINSSRAKEIGFIDKVMFEEENNFVNTAVNTDGTLPPEVIEKLRNEMMVDGKMKVPVNEENTEKPFEDREPKALDEARIIATAKLKLKLKI